MPRRKYNMWLAPSPERDDPNKPAPKMPRMTSWRYNRDQHQEAQAQEGPQAAVAVAHNRPEANELAPQNEVFDEANLSTHSAEQSSMEESDASNAEPYEPDHEQENDREGSDVIGNQESRLDESNVSDYVPSESASEKDSDSEGADAIDNQESSLDESNASDYVFSESASEKESDSEGANAIDNQESSLDESNSSDYVPSESAREKEIDSERADATNNQESSLDESNASDYVSSESASEKESDSEGANAIDNQETSFDEIAVNNAASGLHTDGDMDLASNNSHETEHQSEIFCDNDIELTDTGESDNEDILLRDLYPNQHGTEEYCILPEQELPCDPVQNFFQEVTGLLPHLADAEGSDQHQEPPNEPVFSEAYRNLKEKLRGVLGSVITSQVKVSAGEFLLNTLTLVTHFKLNFAQFEGIMKLVNTLFRDKVFPETRYLLDRLFMAISGIHYHFVCHHCQDYLGEFDHSVVKEVVCENCGRTNCIADLNNSIFFVLFDLTSQLEILFSDEKIFQSLKNPFDLVNIQQLYVMNDVYDGSVYQNFIAHLGPRSDVIHISSCFGVDGSSPYRSSNCQIWPIFCNVLELPPRERDHNLLLGGLWFGKGHPIMDVFLIPFAKHCKSMSEDGFKIILKGKEIAMKCHIIGCCADAPARAAVQCIHQYGGSFSCHWCLHPAEHRRFDVLNYEPEKRTKENFIDDGTKVLALDHAKPSVNGVTGLSPLLSIPTFHIIDGMILEYFHATAHGVARAIVGAWLGDDGCEDVPYYIGTPNNLKKLNKFIQSIHLPIEARRSVRDFDDWANWKGRELENLILYHSIPIFEKLLPRQYLNHWLLFVQAMHFLLQDKISENSIATANNLLREFGMQVKNLYPEHHLTYNLHIVSRHLAENCRRWGPLWSVNGYSFEDGNRILKNKIHASKGISSQVCRALSHQKCLEILRVHVSSPFTEKFRSDIEKKEAISCIYVFNDKYLGIQKKLTPTAEQLFIFTQKGIQWQKFVSVTKIIHDGCVFTAIKSRSTKMDNSIALLKNKEKILISKIIVSEELCEGYLIGQRVRTTHHLPARGIHPRESFLQSVLSVSQESFMISPSELHIVCARITLPHGDYIVKVPNVYNTT